MKYIIEYTLKHSSDTNLVREFVESNLEAYQRFNELCKQNIVGSIVLKRNNDIIAMRK